jgi:hypothetical protein
MENRHFGYIIKYTKKMNTLMTRDAFLFLFFHRVFMTHAGDRVIIWKTWDKALSSSIWMKKKSF